MDNINFYHDQLTCCSLMLHWTEVDEANLKSCELFKKEEGFFNSYEKIYEGESTSYEVINLKPNQTYCFKLIINKTNSTIKKEISVKTLISPHAILSERSVDIANGKQFDNVERVIPDFQKQFIKNCAKLIFEDKTETSVKADFDGLIIKITHEVENNIYYVCIDIKDNYFNDFFNQFIEGGGSNVLIPSNFIIEKLPTLLFLNLLEKGSVIFTGKRMGGVIASSFVFYLLYIGKSINIKYENVFEKRDKKSIGSISFGSPSFITNLTASVKMKEFTSYFYNIKNKNDYIPEIIDFINVNIYKKLDENILSIFHKDKMTENDVNILDNFLNKIDFKRKYILENINKDIKIPFGYYLKMKNDFSFKSINENNFINFYYLKKFDSNSRISNLNIYKELSSNTKFNKNSLNYLEKKDYNLDLVKIIRRKLESGETKSVIKFKLTKFIDNNIIFPDIIDKISLVSYENGNYIISNKDIFYDNDIDITAYIDNLEDNIKNMKIINIFGGEINVNEIMNLQGSGPTRKMLKDNIEKLFLIPFFKLFEIFYISFNDKKQFNELKEQYFGQNYENLKSKILKPFEKQIEILNELLYLSRPDLLFKSKDEFIKMYINDDLEEMNKNWTNEQKNNLNNILEKYRQKAEELKQSQNIDINNKKKIKLFMSKCTFSQLYVFYNIIFDDSFIKNFFIENLMGEALQNIENDIKNNINNSINIDDYKNYLNKNIGFFYDKYIMINIYFIRLIILVSIEGGDLILFLIKKSIKKIFKNFDNFLNYCLISSLNYVDDFRYVFYFADHFHYDFEKVFTKDDIEKINMKNVFYKNKRKQLIKSNISSNSSFNEINRMFAFSECSKHYKIGEQYYNNFLEIFNNYSNDFKEDIEISIFDNLKDENSKKIDNLTIIKSMMNDYIEDEESKKGFLALLRQSYLLGELRTNIVRIYFLIFSFIGR